MQQPGESHTAFNIQKREDMIRKHDSADHQPDHRQEYQHIDNQLKNAKRRISAPEQRPIPVPVEDMVQKKEQKHSGSHPFMRHISPKMIAHQNQQAQCHQNVYQNLNLCFRRQRPVPPLRRAEISFPFLIH